VNIVDKSLYVEKNASKPKKYCSKKCHEKSCKNRIIVKCANCGKEIERTPSKLKLARHGFSFCNRKCKEEAQKLGGKCPEIRPAHFGTGNGEHHYRELMQQEIKLGCVDCFNKTIYMLVVHHIDGNRKNNVKENLEVVCKNCHAKRHFKIKEEKWSFWSASLTPREMLDQL